MEDINEQETIDSKYIIIEKKGHGASASVYLVKDKNQQNVYAAKVLKKPSDLFQNEINMLNAVKKLNSPNIVNIINSGEGLIIRKDHPKKTSQYLVLEYAEKGELFNYIFYANDGFSERHSKLIFYKMLKGIEACHIAGVCHRDLKMQNILVDKNHCPKICDFGFATMNNGHLNQYLGTLNYAAPEILRNKPYDGFKADIFSLGVVLLTLTTCKFGFQKAHKTDKYYKYIMLKYFDEYWEEVSKKIKPISKELKDLFINMVAYKPNERPSIKEILNSEWMKEIRDMNAEQLEQLENEVREEFLKRELLVKEGLSKDIQNPDLTKIFEPYGKLIRCGIKFDKLGNSTGIADVEYDTHEECEEALKKLDCFKINDVEIHVKYAPNSGRFRRMRSAGFIRRNNRRLNRSRRNMSTRRRRNIGIRRSRAGLRQRNNFERKKRRFFAKSLGRRRKQD